MTGLDTNILVRYITQDDPLQSALATRFIEEKMFVRGPWIYQPYRSLRTGLGT